MISIVYKRRSMNNTAKSFDILANNFEIFYISLIV